MAEEWFERSFQEDYMLVYRHRDDSTADSEIVNLLRHLPIRDSGRVLDLCCGNGRHSRALARRGYEVVGVDLSAVLLKQAAEQNSDPHLTYERYDMRYLPFHDEFDIVVNLFTSFGYFSTDQENAIVVHNMAQALKTGGEVVIDYLSPNHVVENLVPYSEKEEDGMRIQEERWIEDGFVKKRILIHDPAASDPREYEEQVRLFTAEQMIEMLQMAGISPIQIFGNYEFEPFHAANSERMIFYAIKQPVLIH